MKVIPQAEAHINQPPTAKVDKVAAAIAAFNASKAAQEAARAAPPASPTHPVQNPSKVTPEELQVVAPSESTPAVSQNDTIEAPAQPVVEPPKPQDPLSAQYAMLARKEKALRQKVQEYKAQEAAFNAEKAALAAKDAEYKSNFIPKDRIKADPLGMLTEMGVSYDQLTQLILNQPQTPQGNHNSQELQALKDEIKSLRDGQDQTNKLIEDQQTQSYQQALNQIKNEAKNLVESDPSFEAIKSTNSVQDVVDLIEKTFKEDNILMTVEDAAKEVEEYLTEEAIKLANLKKVRAKMQALNQASTPQQSEPAKSEGTKQPMKTLTNAVNAATPMSRRDRAIAAMEGRLK